MAHYKRRKPRTQVRCSLCTDLDRRLGRKSGKTRGERAADERDRQAKRGGESSTSR